MKHSATAWGWRGAALAGWVLATAVALADPPTSGLQAWYKADTGVTTDGNGNVSQWNDQSGNNKHATQGTANMRPALSSATMPIGSSMAVIQYHNNNSDGSYDELSLPSVSQDGGSGATVYFVANDDADGTRSVVNWMNRAYTAGEPGIYGRSQAANRMGMYFNGWVTESFPLPSGWKVARYAWDGSGSSTLATNYATGNGCSAASASIPSKTSQWVAMGLAGYGQHTYASFAEVLIYNRALNASERTQVEDYLKGRYFVAGTPTVQNQFATGMTTNAADLVGALTARGGSDATVYLFCATNDCTTNAANWSANGFSTNFGPFSAAATFTNRISGLSANTRYYWNHMASNAQGVAWASTTGSPSFRTQGGAPVVDNASGASAISPTSVTLNGTLTDGSSAYVFIHWWADGGATNVADFGSPRGEGSFSTNITGLTPLATYYYRSFASNDYGTNWAATATSFIPTATTNGNVTWSGGGASPYWHIYSNWLDNAAPANPTAATIYYKTNGQSVVGVLEADRQVGKISVGDGSTTIAHTLDLGGRTLTVAGDVMAPFYARSTLTVTNGTLRVGAASVAGNISLQSFYTRLNVSPGAQLNAYNVNTVTLGYPGWGDAGSGILDLRGAQVAGGQLIVTNLYLYTGANTASYLYLDSSTSLTSLWVKGVLTMQTYGGGYSYIGNPSDSGRLPPNVSVRVGTSPGNRGDLTLGYNYVYTRNADSRLVASSGGTFTAYVTNLWVMRREMYENSTQSQTATLDLKAMESCFIDAQAIRIANDRTGTTPNVVDNQKGALYLPQGTVTAGVVEVGANVAIGGWGVLGLSNTMFVVTNRLTLNTTATNTIAVGASPSGLDVQGAFADSNGNIRVSFLEAPAVATNWAIRIKGDAQTALNTMVGAGRLTSTGSYPGQQAGVLYDGTYTYYAMADSSAFSTLPIAVAYDERTYEYAPGYPVTIATNDVNNGSYDTLSRPLTFAIYTNGGAESATLTFDAVGDYGVTLKVTAGSDSATDTCTVHVVTLNPGVTNALVWNGAASTPLMDRRDWMWSANWVGNVPPTNPTPATLSFQTFGQTVTGRLEAARTVGGLSIGAPSATVNHRVDLNSNTLTVAGTIADAGGTCGFSLTNGTLQIGSGSVTGNLSLTAGATTLKVCPGAKLDPARIGTIQLANSPGGWGTPTAILDLRGVEVVGGVLGMQNLLLHNGGGGNNSYLYLDGNTAMSALAVSNQVVIGQTAGDSACYIGNPADQKLPPGISVRIGTSPAQRGSLLVMRTVFTTRTSTAKLVASGGGAFTAYLSDLTLVKHESSIEAGNTNPQTGILDLSKMDSCAIDTTTLNIAPDRTAAPNTNDNLIGTLALPPGNVVAGTVVVGGATNRGVATLTMSNTTFTVTNAITLHKTARVTVNVGAQSCGLVISNAADTAFSMATATNGALRIVFNAKPSMTPFYGLWWKGDHVAALEALQADGRLVIDSSGLAPRSASILATGGATIIGLPPPRGAVFIIRRLLQNPSRRPPAAVATRGSVSENGASVRVSVRRGV
jgi:hypothetical protein